MSSSIASLRSAGSTCGSRWTRTGPPSWGATQAARATRGDASRARTSKSDAVTARWRVRNSSAARSRAASSDLGVHAAERRPRVLDRGDAGDRAAEDGQRARKHVPAPAAAVPVTREAQRRPSCGHRAELQPRAVCRPDRRAELDDAVGQVEGVVEVIGAALRERLHAVPRLPVAGLGVAHLERLALDRLEHRQVPERERLAGRAVALSERLAGLPRGGGRLDQRPDRSRGDRVDLGRVRELAALDRLGARARPGIETTAQPVAPRAREGHRRAAVRQLELDDAAAVVEAAGAILEDFGLGPLAVPRRDLPAERRVLRVDARALRLRAVDVDLHQQSAKRLVEGQVERVADLRRRRERQLIRPLGAGDAPYDPDVLRLAVALDRVGGRTRDRDGEVLLGLEDDRLLGAEPLRRDLGLPTGDDDVLPPAAPRAGSGCRCVAAVGGRRRIPSSSSSATWSFAGMRLTR